MVKLDKLTVAKLMQLSRIHCNEEEQEALLHDLQKILGYIEQLDQVNTEDVEPCYNVLPLENVMREDTVGGLLDRDVFLENAPSHIGGMVRVPPVIKSKGN